MNSQGQNQVIKRKGHQTAIRDAFDHYLNNDMFSDVHLFCDSHHFRCHRVILASGSEYFETIFSETCIPTACNLFPSMVIVPNMRHEILNLIIEYIYKGSVCVSQEVLEEFQAAADSLKVRGIGSTPAMNDDWNNRYAEDICPTDFVSPCLEKSNSFSSSVKEFKSEIKSGSAPASRFTTVARGRKPNVSQTARSSNTRTTSADTPKAKNDFVGEKRKSGQEEQDEKPKRRRGPRVRPIEENVPESVLADILDAIASVNSNKSPEVETLVGEMLTEYEKIGANRQSSKPEVKKRRSSQEVARMKAEFEESVNKAAHEVLNNKIPIEEAATTHSVSISSIRKRVKILKANENGGGCEPVVVSNSGEKENIAPPMSKISVLRLPNEQLTKLTASFDEKEKGAKKNKFVPPLVEPKTATKPSSIKDNSTLVSLKHEGGADIADDKENLKMQIDEAVPASANKLLEVEDVPAVQKSQKHVDCPDKPELDVNDQDSLMSPTATPSVVAISAVPMESEQIWKSLPIHCIIEVHDNGSTSNSSKTLSERTVVKSETGGSGSGTTSASAGNTSSTNSNAGGNGCMLGGMRIVEVDDFVIIPAGTPFQDVVTTVLTILGYPKDTIQQAEGSILLKNWMPLKLDQVCDSPHKTVGDILNDLSNHATLRVLVTRPKGGTTEDLKEKLLRLLLAQSSNILMGSGCPLDEVTLGQLVKGQWPQNLAEDVKRRFDQWYSAHQQKLAVGLEHHHSVLSHSSSTVPHPLQIGSGNGNNGSSSNNIPVTSSHQHSSHLVNGSPSLGGPSVTSVRHHLLDKTTFDDESHTNHPVFHGLATQKTRMRTSFDPEMELPRLQQWFAENPHPSRHQIQQYVRELNSLECRKDRKPLDLNNVIYWFKNSRAAAKRQSTFSHHYIQSQNYIPSQNPIQLEESNREYLNENSGSSYRNDSDDHDHEMKEYREEEADEAERQDNQEDKERDVINEENGECDRDEEEKVTVKEEHDEDFISVDVELTEGTGGGNVNHSKSPGENRTSEPKDLSGKSHSSNERESEDSSSLKREDDVSGDEKKEIRSVSNVRHPSSRERKRLQGCLETGSNHSTSPSASPRSSPGMSPTHPYDFSGAPSMVSRFHPFFDHPFMAYRHFNSFNFGQNFSGSNGTEGHSPSGYESALGIVGNRKTIIPPGKPSPGMDVFHEFSNGVSMAPSRGSNGGNGDHIGRIRGEDLYSSRSASSAELISSIINSNRGDLGLNPLNLGIHHQNQNSLGLDERRKRNRTFIDPVTEVPRLENWFQLNTHPSHNLILKYTDELNRMPYRQKFPKLEPKNVQFWFKNRRAKSRKRENRPL